MDTYDHVSFYNAPMDTTYYNPTRHLKLLEAAVVELVGLLRNRMGRNEKLHKRLDQMTVDLGLGLRPTSVPVKAPPAKLGRQFFSTANGYVCRGVPKS